MNNSAKCCYIILCLIFFIIILLTLTKDIVMDNNEKKIEEGFGGGGSGAGGFSGGRGGNFGGRMGANMGMRGNNFRQGRDGTALDGAHVYNNRWKHHRSNYYRPYFFGVPLWYWNNNGSYNNDGGSYYDTYPNTVNYNFYDVRESDENNYS